MLTKTCAWITLHKKYYKINEIYDASDDTLVMFGSISRGRDCIIHASFDGQILFEYIFEDLIQSVQMLNKKEVLYVQTRKNRISILNLSDYKFTFINFMFMNEESDQSRIEVFNKSKCFAVIQTGTLNDNRLRISYFAQPINQKSSPISNYESKQNQWTYELILYKVNNHSKMCWMIDKVEDFFVFKSVSLQNNSAIFQIFKIKNSLWYNHLQFTILNVWELRNQVFCFVCLMNNRVKTIKNMNKIIVVDSQTKEVRLAKFFNNTKMEGILFDSHNLGSYCLFRTSLQGVVSTFYGVNRYQEIVAMEYNSKNVNKLKISNPGYENMIFSHFMYENRECKEFLRTQLHFISQKEVILHFMLDLNDDFDEDLMQDIIEMIQFQQI